MLIQIEPYWNVNDRQTLIILCKVVIQIEPYWNVNLLSEAEYHILKNHSNRTILEGILSLERTAI